MFAVCADLAIGARSHSSSISGPEADRVRRRVDRLGIRGTGDGEEPSVAAAEPEPVEEVVVARVRLYELARELGLSNRRVLALCADLGIGVKSHSSSIIDPQADRVRRRVDRLGIRGTGDGEEPAVGAAEPEPVEEVVVARVRLYELARELGLSNWRVLAVCADLGIVVRSHSSAIIGPEADLVRRRVDRLGIRGTGEGEAAVVAAEPEPVEEVSPRRTRGRPEVPAQADPTSSPSASRGPVEPADSSVRRALADIAERARLAPPVVKRPLAATVHGGNRIVYSLTTDGSLRACWEEEGYWTSWGGLGGGRMVSITASSHGSISLVYGLAADSRVRVCGAEGGTWKWWDLGTARAIDAASHHESSVLYAVGVDGGVRAVWSEGGSWRSTALGGDRVDSVAAASHGGKRIVYGLTEDGAVCACWEEEGGWTSWGSMGGSRMVSIAAAAHGSISLVYGLAANGRVHACWAEGGTWKWSELGSASMRMIAAASHDESSVLYAVGVDGAIYAAWSEAGAWRWAALGGTAMVGLSATTHHTLMADAPEPRRSLLRSLRRTADAPAQRQRRESRAVVFALDSTGRVHTRWSEEDAWTAWNVFGG